MYLPSLKKVLYALYLTVLTVLFFNEEKFMMMMGSAVMVVHE